MERSAEFETQHKLLLLETLYDAGLSLGSLPGRRGAGRGRARPRRRRARRVPRIPRDVRRGAAGGVPRPRSVFRGVPPRRSSPRTSSSPRSCRSETRCSAEKLPAAPKPGHGRDRRRDPRRRAHRRRARARGQGGGAAGRAGFDEEDARFLVFARGPVRHGDREPPPPRAADARAGAPRGGEPAAARRDGPLGRRASLRRRLARRAPRARPRRPGRAVAHVGPDHGARAAPARSSSRG